MSNHLTELERLNYELKKANEHIEELRKYYQVLARLERVLTKENDSVIDSVCCLTCAEKVIRRVLDKIKELPGGK